MIIVTTLYNAENYISKCIESIKSQTFKNFTCYITDDLSTDDSVETARKAIGGDTRFVLLKNRTKMYQPGNYDYVIRYNDTIDDHDVVVELDGDDWFPDKHVLQRVNDTYENDDVWVANGSFVYSDGRAGFAAKQQITNNLRGAAMTCSHLRTWRAGLWRKIVRRDLKDEHGIYWSVSGDLSFMYPMLEMAGDSHYVFMEDINYVYNEESPLNDHKVNIRKVVDLAQKIRSMTPYVPIKKLERKKVGLLIIATNKYTEFLPHLLASADEYFLSTQHVEYFIFTNHESINVRSKRKINFIDIKHKPWPWMTLGRYDMFDKNKSSFKNMDYLYYCDADMRFCDTVGDEILSDRVVTQHPGFCGDRGSPESNPRSLAYVRPDEQMQYFAGGFNGGTADEFLKMSKKLSQNIQADHDNGIIATWHDESHMNRYMIDNKPTKILGSEYCTPSNLIDINTKISAIVKDHDYYRQ